MSAHQDPAERSADEAALWAARLEGSTLGRSEQAALEAWLARDPSHRTLLSDYCQFSADLERDLPLVVAAGASDLPEPATARSSSNVRRWILGGTLAAAAALAVAFWVGNKPLETQAIATAVAQRRSLTLADGSQLELNARTSVVIEQGAAERRVRLAEGEAFFSVAKDPGRPFLVETPAGSVRVLGTVFNVRAPSATHLELTVVEGSVQVRPADTDAPGLAAPRILGARDHCTLAAEEVSVRALSESALQDVLAWRSGRIVFDHTPLGEAAERFAHHHGRGISISPAAAELRLGGRFSLDDLDGFFAALEEVLPVRVTRDLAGTVRIRLRSEGSP